MAIAETPTTPPKKPEINSKNQNPTNQERTKPSKSFRIHPQEFQALCALQAKVCEQRGFPVTRSVVLGQLIRGETTMPPADFTPGWPMVKLDVALWPIEHKLLKGLGMKWGINDSVVVSLLLRGVLPHAAQITIGPRYNPDE